MVDDEDIEEINAAIEEADRPIIGFPVDENGNEIHLPEEEHFYICAKCGQAVDRRNLGDVFYHETKNHTPKPTN